ncbi:zinc finger and BTB domain-containing protein 38 [Heterodontus francisci]|uniref:zinc finger and BTB domain-containing protein 38 n=1 Tax=Heterodontus francisci TaxID=7792 RepID=UPI00355B62FD
MASSFEVMDRNHSKVLLHELNEQRIQGIFCDVTIVVQDSKFKAHKNVLAAFSCYFKELLASQTLWAMDPVLELREMKAEVFAKILNFIYSSRVVIERLEEANDLATAGHRLGIHFLKDLVEMTSQTRACNDRLTCSSAQSSVSHSSDFSQLSQGTKVDNHDCTGSKSFEDNVGPLKLWPTNSFFTSKASAGPSFPIDLTASTSRRSGDVERPSSAYNSQTPSSRPESTGNHPSEHSQAASSDQEEDRPPLCEEGNESCPNESGPLTGLFHRDFLKGPSQDSTEETNEAAKRLYTLSTVAFRGLGFSVEEAANPEVLSAPPEKEPVVTLAGPDAAWSQPPVNGPPEEEAGITEDLPADAPAATSYPPGGLPCGHCTRSFGTTASLSLHSKLHRAGKTLSCRYCHKSFIHVKRLHTHQMLCRRADRPPSPEGRHSPADQENPGAAGAEQASGLDSTQPLDLMLAESGQVNAGRKQRAVPRMEILTEEEHFMKVVDGHLLYFCAVCERSYVTLSSLKRHANVHSWRRKYPCRYCDKVFALAEYRTKHEVWHTGERRYQCIFCWETFVTYYNLKTHQKSFHGVDPGLTISQKTPNGGYKPKLNAFKLYRLLPMRSQKRPYKTYSHSVSGDLLKYAQNVPVTLPTDVSSENDLATLSHASPAKYVQEKSRAVSSQSPESQELPSAQDPLHRPTQGASLTESAQNGGSPQRSFSGSQSATSGHDQAMPDKDSHPSEGDVPLPQPPSTFPSPEVATPVPSVITYGHPTSSVIVHSNALPPTIAHRNQSSVIAYNGKCTQEKVVGAPLPDCQAHEPVASLVARPTKKQALKDYVQLQVQPSSACAAINQRHNRQKESRYQKPKKYFLPAKGKTMTYMAKPACAGTASESRSAPLCQITVRIGEEAIVKRRISESDLIRDKGSTSKGRRSEGLQAGGKKHCTDEAERESQQKSDYFLGNDSGDEVSDNDTDDNLWRPYYSYKPKRRAGGFHKTKKSGWRRKLRYRHSARWLQRAAKGPDREAVMEPMEGCSQEPELNEDNVKELESSVQLDLTSCAETFSDRALSEQHNAERVFACSTCGKEFSVLRNLRKHKQSHSAPVELSCRSCDKVFTLAKTLKKHEKTHSSQKLWPPLPQTPQQTAEAPKQAPHSAGRKGPGRHTCAHCSKTCKTAAALGRHQKRHLAEDRLRAPRVDETSSLEQAGVSLEPNESLERMTRAALCPLPPEETASRSIQGDENGVKGDPPNARAGESVEMAQSEDQLQMIAPYAKGCDGDNNAQETEMSPAGESPLISGQDPIHTPRASSEDAPVQELMGTARAGNPMSSIHQMMMLHGGESRQADTPEMRMPYTNASAPEDQVQEMLPSRSRDGSPGTSRQTMPGSPATEHNCDGAAMPCIEDACEGSPPQEMAEVREEGRNFHTLEPMMPHEAVGFEESDQVLETGTDSEYPVQEFPIPLITSGNCRSHTELDGKTLAFHPGTIRFKEGDEDLSKVAFYQDPYQLVYGHQLLAGTYPYNFTHVSPLPVALNMVIRDEKGQQLPLLHRMFVYPTPCRDEAPPLPPPPPLGASGNGSHDEVGRELLAREKGAPMY